VTCRGHIAAVVSALVLLLAVNDAYAVHSPAAEANITTISQHQQRGGTAWVPSASCDVRCQEWYTREGRAVAANVTDDEIHKWLRNSRMDRIKVLPALRTLGTIHLAVETGASGMEDRLWHQCQVSEDRSPGARSQREVVELADASNRCELPHRLHGSHAIPRLAPARMGVTGRFLE
jgi:hypothetical protein